MVSVSVPGKIHLMGEHAVVYGKPALITAINLRLSVAISYQKKSSDTHITIISSEPTGYARHAVDFLLNTLHITDVRPVEIRIDSQIPAGYHLGSSAAVAVGLTGAILYFYKKIWNPIRINELAYEIEKKQHGNPSGGDNTAVTMGGLIWYRKELEFLRSIWQLPFKLHASLNHFFLINTGRPTEMTGEMVEYVRSQYIVHGSRFEKIFNENEKQVKRVTAALKDGNELELLDAIRTGEKTLEDMGVVSNISQSLIRHIEKTGGVAKILGGGGRQEGTGFVLCYHQNPPEIEQLCKPFGFRLQEISLGEEGVRLDEK